MTTIDLQTLLPWSEPKTVNTKAGERILRKAAPTETFWKAWRDGKEALRAAGISCGQFQGAWEVCWWQGVDPVEAARKAADLKAKQDAERAALEAALSSQLAQLPPDMELRMKAIEPRCLPYQVPSVRRQVRALLDYGSAVDTSDTGTGKTYVNLAACGVLGAAVFIVCPLAVMPSWKRAAEYLGFKLAGCMNYEMLRRGKTAFVKLVKVKAKNGKEVEQFQWALPSQTVIIFDECFVAGTGIRMADGTVKKIEDVEAGDLVENAIGTGRVKATMHRPALSLIKVKTSSGEIVCTPGHRFLTQKGWVSACNLNATHYIKNHEDINEVMRVVRPGVQLQAERGKRNQEAFLQSILLSEMEDERALGEIHASAPGAETEAKRVNQARARGESGTCTAVVNQDDGEKSNEECRDTREGYANASPHRASSTSARGEWDWSYKGGISHKHSISGVSEQLPSTNRTLPWVSESLQGGHRFPGVEDSRGMRRCIARVIGSADAGQEEGSETPGIRVVGIEVVEPKDFERYGGGIGGVEVYNLEVSGHPSYVLAGGEVVHNCHRMKDAKTLNAGLGLAALRQGYKVLGLSATAADNPMQMKFTATAAKLIKDEREFFPWMIRNGVVRGRWGLEFTGGREALSRIHKQIFPLHGTRIRIADLGDQFPETQIKAEAYECDADAINRVYEEMAEEIASIKSSEMEDAKKQACILTEMLRARQRTEILKVPAVVSMVEDAIEDGLSVAVFVNFTETLNALAAKLDTKCIIQGGQKVEERQGNIDAFNADSQHVILAIIQAGGVGVSLHGTPASRMRMSIIFPTWSGTDLKQALGRVWRAKGAKSLQRIFFAAGTIEEDICKNVNAKIDRIDILNDGLPDDVLRLRGEEKLDLKLEVEERLGMGSVVTPPTAATAGPRMTSVSYTPAPPTPQEQKRVERRDELDALAAKLTRDQISRAHRAMAQLAECDPDKASEINGSGFNKFDVRIGHELANSSELTPRQGAMAVRLARKYRKQVGDLFPELYES